MKKQLYSLLLFSLAAFCAKNHIKTCKYCIKNLARVINKEICKQYKEKIKKYDGICSHEFLFLENSKYFSKEASDEIFKFLLAKKPGKIHIVLSLINNDVKGKCIAFYHSIYISYRSFIALKLMNNRQKIPKASIFTKYCSDYPKPAVKEYFLQKNMCMFIFSHLNIFKRIFTKIILTRKRFSFVPIFSDIAFLKETDYIFMLSFLFKQTYIYGNDYFLFINDLKINQNYDENKRNKNILEYAFANTTFESIKNLSFEKKEIVFPSSTKFPLKICFNKIVVKEMHICCDKKYLNIYEIPISNFKGDVESDFTNDKFLDIFGYYSYNIEIVTLVKTDKENLLKKNKKSIQEIFHLTIFNRETNIEYKINFSYDVSNDELIDIFITRNIPGFFSNMSLKEKISFILVFLKEYEKINFKLKNWNQLKSLLI